MATGKNDSRKQKKAKGNNYTMAITAKLTGVEPHRIRRYEEGGLVTPERSDGNQRLFSTNDIEVIKQADKLENEGINVHGIKAIFSIRKGERK